MIKVLRVSDEGVKKIHSKNVLLSRCDIGEETKATPQTVCVNVFTAPVLPYRSKDLAPHRWNKALEHHMEKHFGHHFGYRTLLVFLYKVGVDVLENDFTELSLQLKHVEQFRHPPNTLLTAADRDRLDLLLKIQRYELLQLLVKDLGVSRAVAARAVQACVPRHALVHRVSRVPSSHRRKDFRHIRSYFPPHVVDIILR
jgi:hypothetical protein